MFLGELEMFMLDSPAFFLKFINSHGLLRKRLNVCPWVGGKEDLPVCLFEKMDFV